MKAKKEKQAIKSEKGKKIFSETFIKKLVKAIAIILLIVIVVLVAYWYLTRDTKASSSQVSTNSVATVEIMDITSNILSSGIIAPLDTYSVMAMVSGEVVSADFEEGYQVEKDQVLYQIDTDSVNNSIEAAQKKHRTFSEKLQNGIRKL